MQRNISYLQAYFLTKDNTVFKCKMKSRGAEGNKINVLLRSCKEKKNDLRVFYKAFRENIDKSINMLSKYSLQSQVKLNMLRDFEHRKGRG